jgi:hypothetical protein
MATTYGDGVPGSGIAGEMSASRLPKKAKDGLDLLGAIKEWCNIGK